MTVMAWLWIGLSILGAIVLAVVVWLAGPLVSIGDVQPFDSALVRLIIIAVILLAVGGAIAWRIISRRRAAAKIAEAMTETVAEDSDAPVLKQKMEDALARPQTDRASRTRALFTIFPGTSSSDRPAPARRRRSSIRVSSFRSPGTTRPWPCRASAGRDIATGGSPTKRC